jgi:excisionase family DNA binding protein
MTAIDPNLSTAILALAQAIGQDGVPELMTAAQAAKALHIDPKTFREEVRAGNVRFIMIGRRPRYTAADLRAFLESKKGAPPCPSISRRAPRSTTTISRSKGGGIVELRAQTISKRQRP